MLIHFVSGVLESQDPGMDGNVKRAGSVQLIGCDERFWDLDVTGVRPTKMPDDDGVVINQSAADELGVKVGDLVTVRLPVEQAVPAVAEGGADGVSRRRGPRCRPGRHR